MRNLLLMVQILIFSTPLYAGQLKVIDKDTNKGVECNVRKTNIKDDSLITEYHSDQAGGFNDHPECKKGERLEILPVSNRYWGNEFECPIQTSKVGVRSKLIEAKLADDAAAYFEEGKYTLAALAYQDLAARLRERGSDEVANVEKKVFESLGKHLNVSDAAVFDPNQNKYVQSSRLREKIESFQLNKFGQANGMTDSRTIHKITGHSSNEVIFDTNGPEF